MANSITYQGITWTFATDRPVGTFANGEPYVVGPVSVIAISPNPATPPANTATNEAHGSMKNPLPNRNQGFHKYATVSSAVIYDPALNVAINLPISLSAGDSLVSSKGLPSTAYPEVLQTVCVLTVVSGAVPAGSFRPGFYGNGPHNVVHNVSSVNVNLFPNYAAPASTPSKAVILSLLPALPWFEWSSDWAGNELQPLDNTVVDTYGRDIAARNGVIGLWLCTNQSPTDKMDVLLRWIQNGIDIYSYVKAGGGFYHDGGHKCGRKLPMVTAAFLLPDNDLKAYASNNTIFQEDTQTWQIVSGDVGRGLLSGAEQYVGSDVGEFEWGIRHRWEPVQDDRRANALYRPVVWPAMSGAGIAGELMGTAFKSLWNHTPFFQYNLRWMLGADYNGSLPKLPGGTGVAITPKAAALIPSSANGTFQRNMWDLGSGYTPSPAPPVNTVLPAITGSANAGITLVGNRGTWTGYPAPTYAYQWVRTNPDGSGPVAISGATLINYTATTFDLGYRLRLRVYATNTYGADVLATSAVTGIVQPAPPPSPTYSLDNHITPGA